MENKSLAPFLAILSAIFVLVASGCTFLPIGDVGSGRGGGTQGVAIENFESDFSKIYSGEEFKLQMMMRNIGDVDANSVYPKLYNIDSSGAISPSSISCTDSCTEPYHLLAPDPDRGTTGESRTCIWDCIAPTGIDKGLSVTYNPSVRLYYFYQTHTIKSINIASQSELRSLETQGKAPPAETVSTTSGPVRLDVVVNGPIRYWPGENELIFPININIDNVGSGTTCGLGPQMMGFVPGTAMVFGVPVPIITLTGCDDPVNWNKVYLKFDGNDPAMQLSCNQQVGQGIEVELWKGKSASVTCEVVMTTPDIIGVLGKSIKFYISYAYFKDSSVPVEVIGR